MHDPVSKAEMRATLRAARKDRVPPPEHGSYIAEHITDLEPITRACESGAAIACYTNRLEEPSTLEVRRALKQAGARVLLPRIEGQDLVWCLDGDATMTTNSLGIDEPVGEPIDEQPAAWIIPALAIDEDGYRLGQGGGFYDRALQDLPDDGRGPIIALVFEDEIVQVVPREDHDIPVDIVVTPERVRWLAMPD